MDIASPILGYKGAKDANDQSQNMAREQMAFNSAEAQKNRDFQTAQRENQYQTVVQDLKKAGLNPMLAYNNGSAGTTSGATATSGGLPQVANKAAAALAATAQRAQISATEASTEKTRAETEVARATAEQVKADTALKSNSAENVKQQTVNLQETIGQIRANVNLAKEQAVTEQQRRYLMSYEAQLKQLQAEVENERIPLVKAQTKLTGITSELSSLEIEAGKNKEASDKTWWGKNVRPYLNDASRAGGALNSATRIYQLTR